MKIKQKGTYEYLDWKKKNDLLKMLLSFGLVAAIFVTGYVTTGKKENLLTVAAILGVLPAARLAASALTRMRYRAASTDTYKNLEQYRSKAVLLYNLIWTTRENTSFIDCVAVQGHNVYGYASDPKTDTAYAEKHVRAILKGNNLNKMNIKIHKSEDKLASWLKALPDQTEVSAEEEQIAGLLQQISL